MLFIGWHVVEKFARRREQRADLRSAVTSFATAIDEVRDAAVAFYRLPGNDPQALALATTIRVAIGALADQLAILRQAGLAIDTDELLKRLRQSVTGGDFESQARQPLAENSSAFIKMSGDTQALSRAVQTAMLERLLGKSD